MTVSSEDLRIVGYDAFLAPRVPYEIQRIDDDADKVVFAHHQEEDVLQAMIAPSADAANPDSQLALAPNTEIAEHVLAKIVAVPYEPGWRIQTPAYTFAWPKGLKLWSAEASWGFEITRIDGPTDELIYLQGPFPDGALPAPEALVAEGMTEHARGTSAAVLGDASWIEIAYDAEGSAWRQRRYFVAADDDGGQFLVTAQSPAERSAEMFAFADEIVRDVVARTGSKK